MVRKLYFEGILSLEEANSLTNNIGDVFHLVFNEVLKYLINSKKMVLTKSLKSADVIFIRDFHIYNFCVLFKKNKNIILYEPPATNLFQYKKTILNLFDRVFTWSSELKGKNILQYDYPQNIIKKRGYKNFNERQFLCVASGNKFSYTRKELYSFKKKDMLYFQDNCSLDVYGQGWNKKNFSIILFLHILLRFKEICVDVLFFDFVRIKYLMDYLFNLNKIKENNIKGIFKSDIYDLYNNYKYVICYENSIKKDYMTEKIFNCFNARSVPIYFGDPDIHKKVPRNCYIDRRNFKTTKDLLYYLKNISLEEYDKYIKNIEKFLNTTRVNKHHYKRVAKNIVKNLEL